MRRWLYVWGPDLFGALLTSTSISGATWCVLGTHWFLMPFPVAGALVAFFACFHDLCEHGPRDREVKLDRSERELVTFNARLAAVTKDRDELRDTLATLQLEPAPNDKGRAVEA